MPIRTFLLPLCLLLALGVNSTAQACSGGPPELDGQDGPGGYGPPDGGGGLNGRMAHRPSLTLAAPRPWTALTPQQRFLLSPFQDHWDHMPPDRQAEMLGRAAEWARLPPERQQEIRQHIEQWQQMSPAERERIRANFRFFHQLTPIQRDRLQEAFARFQQLPLAERQALIARWQSLTPSQREAWLASPGDDVAIPPPPGPPHRQPGWPDFGAGHFDHPGPDRFGPPHGPPGMPPPRPPPGFGPPPSDS